MSRSRKHNPVSLQRNDTFMKRYASRVVRRTFRNGIDLANGNAYRRLFCSWNICDWRIFSSFYAFRKEALLLEARYPQHKNQADLEKDIFLKFRKWYINK